MFTLPEKITVWNALTEDGLGGKTWSAPVVCSARISRTMKKVTDGYGDSWTSTSSCYTDGDSLKEGSMVLFGESVATSPTNEANDVRKISESPSGAPNIRKLWFA